MNKDQKTIYVCCPLTKLPEELRESAKAFYSKIADCAEDSIGIRGYAPHEHSDPHTHLDLTYEQVYHMDRDRLNDHTTCVVVVALDETWGGGIELGMVSEWHTLGIKQIPVVILKEKGQRLSRLLLGIPNLVATLEYETEEQGLALLHEKLKELGL